MLRVSLARPGTKDCDAVGGALRPQRRDRPAGRNVLHSLVRAEEGTSTTHTIPLVTLVRIFTSVYNATSFTVALNRGRTPSEGNPGAAKAAPRTPLFLRSRH